jgi:OOP family OmpA-OmpF porin
VLRGVALKNGNQLDVPGTIHFHTGSAKIIPNEESLKVLTSVLEILKKNEDIASLSVEGNTDNAGERQGYDNVGLSQLRSEAVVEWLHHHGIDQARLQPVGHGATHPLVENDTVEHKRQNRRVEFHVLEFNGQVFEPRVASGPPATSPK